MPIRSMPLLALSALILAGLPGCAGEPDAQPKPETTAAEKAAQTGTTEALEAGEDHGEATQDSTDEGALNQQEMTTSLIFKSATEALKARRSVGAVGAAPSPYVFYLHGSVVEGSDGRPTHPERGTYEYSAILEAMAATGVTVISEIRPAQTSVDAYADLIVEQIQGLLDAGVAADRVSVVGFSKGGNIALRVSDRLANDDLGFVIMGGCGEWLDDVKLDLRGRVLSITEESDELAGSCRPVVERSSTNSFFHETVTTMGLGHGSFFEPRDAWMNEALLWCNAPGLMQQITAPQRLDG